MYGPGSGAATRGLRDGASTRSVYDPKMPSLLAMAAPPSGPGLKELLIILAAAGIVAVAMQRLRLAIIPAYLIAGAAIGPGGWGLISSPDSVASISELAIVLLLFGIGLHTDVGVLRYGWKRSVSVGVGSTLLAALVMWPVAIVAGLSAPAGLAVALALSMSSTAVVLRILQERRELHTPDGRLSFSTLLIQDFIAIGAMLAIPTLAVWNGTRVTGAAATDAPPTDLLRQFGAAVAGVTAIVLIGKLVLPRILHEAAKQKSSEAMMVVSTAAALGAAGLTQVIGLSSALGAFLGGFLLSSTPFRHQLSGQLGPLRDLFSAVFFTAIGMAVDLPTVADHAFTIIVATLAMVTLKTVAIALSCWALGATGNVSAKVGVTLAQAGEFSLVLLGVASAPGLGLLSGAATVLSVSVVVLSLMVTPLMMNVARWLDHRMPRVPAPRWASGRNAARGAPADAHASAPQAIPVRHRRVIIAGYGLVGRVVADALTAKGADATIIDMNPATVQTQGRLGRRIVFGDVSNPDVLESAGLHEADALILTIPDEEIVLRACQEARKLNPSVIIIARTNYVSKGMVATGLGANHVVIEELATAESMEKIISQVLGDPPTNNPPAGTPPASNE